MVDCFSIVTFFGSHLRRLILVCIAGVGGCGHAEDPNCNFDGDAHNYRLNVSAPAATGAAFEVLLSNDGQEARYTFAPLRDCSDQTAPAPCVVASGPRPAVCDLTDCTLRLDFPGSKGRQLSDYLGTTEIPCTVSCDDVTVQNGWLPT